MGLDGVELIMEWEEEFEIEIPDEKASRIRTVGEVVDLVHAQLRTREARNQYCRTSRAFYDLRRCLCRLTGLPRRAISPKTRLEELISRSRRRRVWSELRRAGFSLPSLTVPEDVSVWGVILMLIIGGGFWVLMVLTQNPWVLLVPVLIGVLGWLAARPLAREVPFVCPTVGDLVISGSPLGGGTGDAPGCLPRSEISRRVRMMVAEQLVLPPEEVREESRFVEDLRLDR
jgi:acyl carrier protein